MSDVSGWIKILRSDLFAGSWLDFMLVNIVFVNFNIESVSVQNDAALLPGGNDSDSLPNLEAVAARTDGSGFIKMKKMFSARCEVCWNQQ